MPVSLDDDLDRKPPAKPSAKPPAKKKPRNSHLKKPPPVQISDAANLGLGSTAGVDSTTCSQPKEEKSGGTSVVSNAEEQSNGRSVSNVVANEQIDGLVGEGRGLVLKDNPGLDDGDDDESVKDSTALVEGNDVEMVDCTVEDRHVEEDDGFTAKLLSFSPPKGCHGGVRYKEPDPPEGLIVKGSQRAVRYNHSCLRGYIIKGLNQAMNLRTIIAAKRGIGMKTVTLPVLFSCRECKGLCGSILPNSHSKVLQFPHQSYRRRVLLDPPEIWDREFPYDMFDSIVQCIVHRLHIPFVFVDYGFDLEDDSLLTVALEDWKDEKTKYLVVLTSMTQNITGPTRHAMIIVQLDDHSVYVYDPRKRTIEEWSGHVSKALKRWCLHDTNQDSPQWTKMMLPSKRFGLEYKGENIPEQLFVLVAFYGYMDYMSGIHWSSSSLKIPSGLMGERYMDDLSCIRQLFNSRVYKYLNEMKESSAIRVLTERPVERSGDELCEHPRYKIGEGDMNKIDDIYEEEEHDVVVCEHSFDTQLQTDQYTCSATYEQLRCDSVLLPKKDIRDYLRMSEQEENLCVCCDRRMLDPSDNEYEMIHLDGRWGTVDRERYSPVCVLENCGHRIHKICLQIRLAHGIRHCPVCNSTIAVGRDIPKI